MQEWLLDREIQWEEVSAINGCGIEYIISDKTVKEDDSGWCDYSTGQRFLTPTTRITFNVKNKKDALALKLMFGDAISPSTFIFEDLPE